MPHPNRPFRSAYVGQPCGAGRVKPISGHASSVHQPYDGFKQPKFEVLDFVAERKSKLKSG
jgi:hypothetical protein